MEPKRPSNIILLIFVSIVAVLSLFVVGNWIVTTQGGDRPISPGPARSQGLIN